MRYKNKLAVAVLLAAAVMSTASCGKEASESGAESSYYKVSIDGEQTAIPEDDKNIAEIKQLAENYLRAAVTKDYKNPVKDAEFQYYTKAVEELNRANGVPENNLATMANYELVQEFNGHETEKIEFYKLNGEDAADITGTFVGTITHSNEAYTQAVAWEDNVQYRRSSKLTCVLEDGAWKIKALSTGAREAVK